MSWLDKVDRAFVFAEDSELIEQALKRPKSVVLTNKNGYQDTPNAKFINPHTYDPSKICGTRSMNLYILSDISEHDEIVNDMISGFYSSGQLVFNKTIPEVS